LSFVADYLADLQRALSSIDERTVNEFIQIFRDARDSGRTIFLCGNGGSAATASHFANDLGKGGHNFSEKRFRVIALTDNVPWMTALANDVSYESVFVEQLKNFAQPGDVLFALSGSGNSPNVLRAVEYANSIGCLTLGVSAFGGGKLAQLVQKPLVVDTKHMGRAEDAHMIITHLIGYFFMEGQELTN
jgi:D-sedoheptulose 7-phosphate isomerase